MSDKLLVKAIEQYESQAETHGELSKDRAEAIDYYLGNPLGNEIDGRSQVISRDVWDTVEWIKPQLADIFCGGDEVINFTPRGPEDVAAAEQETEFVNYVITQKNNWFETWYSWSHDALLQKVGYVKAYWDESEDRTKEKYAGLTDDELVLLLRDEDVEATDWEKTDSGWDIEVERVKKYGCVRLVNVAPENVYIDSNARNLNLHDPSCNFSEHREQKTISQLRNEGFDVADDLSDAGTSASEFEDERRLQASSLRSDDGEENTDPAMRKVWVRECWIRYDHDGDGRAELRHVIIVGTTILLNEEADSSLLVALCPTPLPHQHTGLSLHDAVKDLQLIKTALLRGSLDNLYLANNGRYAVDASAVNLDDMLVSRPGGVVRVNGMRPAEAIFPLQHSTTGDAAVPMMEYVDRIAQKRTGVNEQAQGVDPNTLNKTATGAQMLMSAAQQRIKFIARIFAETGVKTLFNLVHALTLKHSRKAEMIRLRNQWIPVDPRQWVKRADMQISVGLGAGDKMQQIIFLEGVLQKQILAMQAGLTSPPKVYNALKRLTQAGGFKDPDEFWDDPTTKPPMPPQPNPEVLKEQAKAQAALQLKQLERQTQLEIEDRRAALKMREIEATLGLQASNDARDAQREETKILADAAAKEKDRAAQVYQSELTQQTTLQKTAADNATKVQIAEMQARVQVHSQDQQAEQAAQEGDKSRMHEEKMADKTHEHAKEQTKVAAKVEKPEPKTDQSAKKIEALEKTIEKVIEGQKQIEETLRKPKKLIRDKDGNITGATIGD